MAKLAVSLLTVLALAASGGAQAATISLTELNAPLTETSLYFTGAAGVTSGTANVGSQTGSPTIAFTNLNTASDFANGFATITPDTGLITNLDIVAPQGYVFNDIEFRAQGPAGNAPTSLTVTAFNGTTNLGSSTISNIGNGAQLLLAALLPGSFMTSLNITSNGLAELKQFQVSGLSSVPLPSASLLFGTGIVGLGLLARRRRKSTSTGAL